MVYIFNSIFGLFMVYIFGNIIKLQNKYLCSCIIELIKLVVKKRLMLEQYFERYMYPFFSTGLNNVLIHDFLFVITESDEMRRKCLVLLENLHV